MPRSYRWWQLPGVTALLIATGSIALFLSGYAGLYWAVWGTLPPW